MLSLVICFSYLSLSLLSLSFPHLYPTFPSSSSPHPSPLHPFYAFPQHPFSSPTSYVYLQLIGTHPITAIVPNLFPLCQPPLFSPALYPYLIWCFRGQEKMGKEGKVSKVRERGKKVSICLFHSLFFFFLFFYFFVSPFVSSVLLKFSPSVSPFSLLFSLFSLFRFLPLLFSPFSLPLFSLIISFFSSPSSSLPSPFILLFLNYIFFLFPFLPPLFFSPSSLYSSFPSSFYCFLSFLSFFIVPFILHCHYSFPILVSCCVTDMSTKATRS